MALEIHHDAENLTFPLKQSFISQQFREIDAMQGYKNLFEEWGLSLACVGMYGPDAVAIAT